LQIAWLRESVLAHRMREREQVGVKLPRHNPPPGGILAVEFVGSECFRRVTDTEDNYCRHCDDMSSPSLQQSGVHIFMLFMLHRVERFLPIVRPSFCCFVDVSSNGVCPFYVPSRVDAFTCSHEPCASISSPGCLGGGARPGILGVRST
jgi:hypothetical protein